jgi:hypothetical protein
MKTAPEGLSPAFFWAAAGECLLAVASAPGERSYVYGKPMPETGNCISGPFRGAGAGATTPGYRRVRAVGVAGPWCGGAWRDACIGRRVLRSFPGGLTRWNPGSSTSGRSESADPWRSGRGEGGAGREFGINGGSSGKDGVITMGSHRWYSLSYAG